MDTGDGPAAVSYFQKKLLEALQEQTTLLKCQTNFLERIADQIDGKEKSKDFDHTVLPPSIEDGHGHGGSESDRGAEKFEETSSRVGTIVPPTDRNECDAVETSLALDNENVGGRIVVMAGKREQEAEDTLMAKVLTVLENMDKKLGILEKNSTLDHNDQPFALHDLEKHESAWRAVSETLHTTIKEKVDRWKSGMDSSLIFVGLFVTIITAFLTPLLQNLTPNPSDLTNGILSNLTTIIYEIAVVNGFNVPTNLTQPEPFQASLSDEIVSLVWYSALLLSLITAIFSVFGRQWVEHLTLKPKGKSYRERAQRFKLREELANGILKPALDTLHPILVSSISLFIVGLLYQLWTISMTGEKSITLILTSSIGSGLILCAMIAAAWTVLHGGYCEESPFTISISVLIRKIIPKRFLQDFEEKGASELSPLLWYSVTQMEKSEHYDHVSSARMFSGAYADDSHKVDLALHILGSDASRRAKLTTAWNLLDLGQDSRGYEELQDALKTVVFDTPPNEEKVRLGFLFVKMVVILRTNEKQVEVFTKDSYLDKEKIKKVFVAVLLLPGYDFEKYEAAVELALMARDDIHFFDDVSAELANAVLVGDGLLWKKSILLCMRVDDVTELLRGVAQKTEIRRKDFLILHFIYNHCQKPLPDDLDLSNYIRFSMTHNYYEIRILLLYFEVMNDALLSRQRGLLELLEGFSDKPDKAAWLQEAASKTSNLLHRIRALE